MTRLRPSNNAGQVVGISAAADGAAAIAQFDRANLKPAAGQLEAFLNEVHALIESGRLPAADGAALMNSVNRILAAMSFA